MACKNGNVDLKKGPLVGRHEKKQRGLEKAVPVKEKTVPNYVLKKGAQWSVGLKKRQRRLKKGPSNGLACKNGNVDLKKGPIGGLACKNGNVDLKKGSQ